MIQWVLNCAALLVASIAVNLSVHAEGATIHKYLIPYRNGDKQEFDIEKKSTVREMVDFVSGLIYQIDNSKLSAYRVGEVKPLYIIDPESNDGTWLLSPEKNVVYVTSKGLISYSKIDGKKSFENQSLSGMNIVKGGEPTCSPPWTNGEEPHIVYLTGHSDLESFRFDRGHVKKYDLHEGKCVWKKAMEPEVQASMYVAYHDGVRLGENFLAADGGPPIEMKEHELHFAWRSQDFLVNISSSPELKALARESHEIEWRAAGLPPPHPSNLENSAAIIGATIRDGRYIGFLKNGNAAVVDLNLKKIAYVLEPKFRPIWSKNHILVCNQDEKIVRALRPETGEKIWEYSAKQILVPEFAGQVVVEVERGELRWLDARNGVEMSQWKLPAGIFVDKVSVSPELSGWGIHTIVYH